MLTLDIAEKEYFDDETKEFLTSKATTIQLEHSLAAISKWEGIWEKPFLNKEPKTIQEARSYIQCMCVTENVDSSIVSRLSIEEQLVISKYIEAKMTATWFSSLESKTASREIITAEIIYYSLVTLNIPFECEHWHINRLLALINVCNVKNSPPKKIGREEMIARNRQLNAQRRAQARSTG